MIAQTTRRAWLRTNAATLGWLITGLPGIAGAADAGGGAPGARGPVRLCYNENPYGPGPKAIEAIQGQIRRSNRYPLELERQLRQVAAHASGLGADRVALGSGSSEILGLATSLAAKKGPGQILMGSPTYTGWLSPAGQLGLETKGIALDSRHQHDLGAMAAAINDRTRMVYLCNPSNPTGTASPESEMREFIRQAAPKTLIVVDEAYYDFPGTGSVADMVNDFPALLVTRSFSKIYGLAGLRVGYGLGQMAGALAGRQGWPNGGVGNLALAAALASMQDEDFVKEMREENRRAMEFTAGTLKDLDLEYIPSMTNFVLFDASAIKGDAAQALERRGVLVKNWEMKGKRYCRVSMGTMEEMGVFAEHLKAVVRT